MTATKVLIHMQQSYLDSIKELGLDYLDINDNEIDVIVDDVEYKNGNHPDMNGIWQDPDMQLCEHYGIDWDYVNMIELA